MCSVTGTKPLSRLVTCQEKQPSPTTQKEKEEERERETDRVGWKERRGKGRWRDTAAEGQRKRYQGKE